MPKGNLDKWLHLEVREDEPQRLTLLQRLSIAIDVAFVLDYLHTQCDEIVVHNDLKPNNVLLDNDMMGHIRDLCTSKISYVVSCTIIAISTDIYQIAQIQRKGLLATLL